MVCKDHLKTANESFALTFSLSGGNAHDALEDRALLANWASPPKGAAVIKDRTYEGDETCQLVLDLGMIPVVQAWGETVDQMGI